MLYLTILFKKEHENSMPNIVKKSIRKFKGRVKIIKIIRLQNHAQTSLIE